MSFIVTEQHDIRGRTQIRGLFATLPVGLDAEDAAVVLAEAELIEAWNRHVRLFDAASDPHDDPLVTAARARTAQAGLRLAKTPAAGLIGLAVKAHHLALDIEEGHTDWSRPLAQAVLEDVRKLTAG